ncbi:forkhead box protein P3 isoform X1 [Paramormyrops kingsleyae]|uniref:forkhead box protein P3 isoform X1 n=1 Tax=Paramormyrops kingsleyae TaxID=1676925 RepID=UPI003B97CE08
MPGNERKIQSDGREPTESKAQRPREEPAESPKTPPQVEDVIQPVSTQVSFPLMFGSVNPFNTTSQLHTILLKQCPNDEVSKQLLQLMSLTPQLSQHRPSVLRRATHLFPQDLSLLSSSRTARSAASNQSVWPDQGSAHTSDLISVCKVETSDGAKVSPTMADCPLQQTSHSIAKASSTHSTAQSGLGSLTALFVNGLCRWPGCEEMFEENSNFLKHLYRDHGRGDRSIAQWRVQQDMVQHMETQLTMEKRKLLAMQLHLHMPEHRPIDSPQQESSERQQLWLRDSVPCSVTKDAAQLVPPSYWPVPNSHFVPELVPSIDCYKYHNIRPPYTYASLIRWAILDSPEKQLTLNEIYHWFTKMFYYFRHNTATWKNAVRHNLSLHKCFVRVEGGKGAVWTVDETEFQRRKGQKFNRSALVLPVFFWHLPLLK